MKEFRNLGIIKADPSTYVQQYGSQLRPTQGLPDFIKGLPTPNLGPEYVRIFFICSNLNILIQSVRFLFLRIL